MDKCCDWEDMLHINCCTISNDFARVIIREQELNVNLDRITNNTILPISTITRNYIGNAREVQQSNFQQAATKHNLVGIG